MTCKTLFALGAVLLPLSSGTMAAPGQADELWFGQVEPLLDRNCFKCHGGVRQKSGLDLRSLEHILQGGDRGPAIVPGKPEQSHLVQFVLKGSDPHMPLDEKKQLADRDIQTLKDWISALPETNRVLPAAEKSTNWVAAY